MDDSNIDSNKLSKVLDKKQNEVLLSLNSKKILEMNLQIINELMLPKEVALDYMSKLKDYRYVDNIHHLKIGTYIRWINILDPDNLKLQRGGIICDIKKSKKEDIIISCKSISRAHFNIKLDECLLFQKRNKDEDLIISVMDFIGDN
jgi:hypothetical protein